MRERLLELSNLLRYPNVATGFSPSLAGLKPGTTSDLAEIYTSTFDLAPACSPYVGVHLFGDENPDRARLMVGLRLAYKRLGMSEGDEMPDHIANVLAFASRDSEERDELMQLVLIPALRKMNDILAPTSNPYREVVAEALKACGGES